MIVSTECSECEIAVIMRKREYLFSFKRYKKYPDLVSIFWKQNMYAPDTYRGSRAGQHVL